MLYIPANSSSTGVYELRFENTGRALIFETETDTLTQSFKSEHEILVMALEKVFTMKIFHIIEEEVKN
jgi:hypothetical protein